MDDTFSHLIEMNYNDNKIIIYRVFSNGTKQLFTSVNFPVDKYNEDKKVFSSFAKMLGENILLDSPVAREIFDL